MERCRDLVHLALETPRFGGVVANAPHRLVREGIAPLARQVGPHALFLDHAEDGGQQRRAALGVGGVTHFEGRGGADALGDDRGGQWAVRKTRRHLPGSRAGQIQAGPGVARPGRSADDAAIDVGRTALLDDPLDAARAFRRHGVAVDVQARKATVGDLGGHLLGSVRRADGQQDFADSQHLR